MDMINRTLLAGTLAASTVMTAGAALADADHPMGYQSHMWGGGYGWSMMGGGMLLFWILVIVLVVLAVRWFNDRDGKVGGNNSALDILKERLARGEIEPAEYEERRKALED